MSGFEPPRAPVLAIIRSRIAEVIDEISLGRWRLIGVALLVTATSFLYIDRRDLDSPSIAQVDHQLPKVTTTVTTEPKEIVVVQLAGAVVRPGVFELEADARLGDAVALAGGPTVEADLDRVNMAARLTDGEFVYLLKRGEGTPPEPTNTPSVAGSGAKDQKVNINRAGPAELETLPGVGPSTARAIVEYRDKNGSFRVVDDLTNVRGIGPSKLEELRDRARV